MFNRKLVFSLVAVGTIAIATIIVQGVLGMSLVLQRHFRVLHRKTCDNARKTMVRGSHMAEMAL